MAFKTAYAFYHGNGGRRVFPFTYAYYLKVERGASLPTPAWLAALLAGLRNVGSAQRARLTRDYLRDLSGTAAVYDAVFAPLIRMPGEADDRRVMRNLRSHMTYNVTPAQYRTLVEAPEAYGCLTVMINTAGALKPARMAELLGAEEKSCARALGALKRCGLVRAAKDGRFAMRYPDRFHCMPTDAASLRLNADLRKRLDALAERQGESFSDVWATARLDRTAIDAISGYLQESVLRAVSHGLVTDDASDAPLCLVECRLRRVAGVPRGEIDRVDRRTY